MNGQLAADGDGQGQGVTVANAGAGSADNGESAGKMVADIVQRDRRLDIDRRAAAYVQLRIGILVYRRLRIETVDEEVTADVRCSQGDGANDGDGDIAACARRVENQGPFERVGVVQPKVDREPGSRGEGGPPRIGCLRDRIRALFDSPARR